MGANTENTQASGVPSGTACTPLWCMLYLLSVALQTAIGRMCCMMRAGCCCADASPCLNLAEMSI